MYEKVLSAKLDGTSILFVGSNDSSCCRELLLGYILHRLQQEVAVTLVPCRESCTELPGQRLLDVRPLREPATAAAWYTADALAEKLEAALPPSGSSARLLAIEDASCLMHWLGPATICQLVQQCRQRGHQMVLAVSEQAVGEDWLAQLRHFATHVLEVDGAGRELTVRGTCRFKAGKVETAVELVCLDEELRLSRVEPVKTGPTAAAAARHAPPASPLTADLTTFSLQLSDTEKQSRSQLVLPYLRPEQSDGLSGPGTGQIFYQPDAADDWDEEDPDDDLDI